MTDPAQFVGFMAFAFLIVISGISMLAAEKIVHSAAFLLIAMLAVAGVYTLLSAEFLATIQVMVYAGAVMVLMLFTVMLTITAEPSTGRRNDMSWGAALVSFAFGIGVYGVLAQPSHPIAPGPALAPQSTVEQLGRILFSDYVLPFELASIVLLIALIGAIHIALEGEE